jgi:hypothetical protein
MKQVGFAESLIPLVRSGVKTKAWRLFDDKDIRVGDVLEFVHATSRRPFAQAKVTQVVEKSFRELSAGDKDGHEPFVSDAEMYRTYSKYYRCAVTPDTLLKIIRFEIFRNVVI